MADSAFSTFQEIIHRLVGSPAGRPPLTNIPITEQFISEDVTPTGIARNCNAAFLIALSGERHPLYDKALSYLTPVAEGSPWQDLACFYREGLNLVRREVSEACATDERLRQSIDDLRAWLEDPASASDALETVEATRRLFFPEGVGVCTDREKLIDDLRRKRTVTITQLNPCPIRDPFQEILFTSNILLTVPAASQPLDSLPLSDALHDMIKAIEKEEQIYWYDHPVQIGVPAENNEVLYGLRGLQEALTFEKQRKSLTSDQAVTCLLSVSVTHKGLHALAKKYLQEAFKHVAAPTSLKVHIVSETETELLIDEILVPAAQHYLQHDDASSLLHEVIGVDGEYGRHYSFLKAVSAFWHVLINPAVRGTFKIDLDQVFPQQDLVEQSGASAFEHFLTPLWGAQGNDYRGDPVDLGMIAGALVNERDIGASLFTPDVCFPPQTVAGDELVFHSALPQALSTEAEMMTRYGGTSLDGKTSCIQRIHVTGGTCGILVDSLRTYRPFTPTFIGRAEDQAYLLSVLFKDENANLRYVHKDGLIMRHDKDAFAGEAIKTAYIGKIVGDYARILWFSAYARALPWPSEETKELIDPFTGCFISSIPLTIVHLRLALKAASFFAGDEETQSKGVELLSTGAKRLSTIIQYLNQDTNPLIEQYQREKKAWDVYYDILDQIEAALMRNDPFAVTLQEKARKLIEETKLKI